MGDSRRSEWLRWRQQGIGGSDAAAIVGLDPWKSAMSVWLSKTTELDDQDEVRDGPMHWGKLLEPIVIDEFEETTALVVTDRQARVERPDWPIMRATLDGLVRDPAQDTEDDVRTHHLLGLYEGKTASRGSDAWRDGVPDHVQVQVQHQLAVTGLDQAWVAALLLSPTPRLEVFTVERDAATVEVLLEAENAFWKLVLDRRPPATDGAYATTLALRHAYNESKPTTVELTDDQAALVREYQSAQMHENNFKRVRMLCEQQLMAVMGDNEIATVDGNEAVTWKGFEQRRVDLDALRLKHPKIAKEHTKAIKSRRFYIKSTFSKGVGNGNDAQEE